MQLGPQTATHRGFPQVEFKDYYEKDCHLQASSLALYEQPGISAVWLGISNTEAQVMAKDAERLGVKTDKTVGWVPYPIPREVLVTNCMHLDRKQVKALRKALGQWLKNGNFVEQGEAAQ